MTRNIRDDEEYRSRREFLAATLATPLLLTDLAAATQLEQSDDRSVVSPDGKVVFQLLGSPGRLRYQVKFRGIRHSSIFAGGPVASAGNIAIEEGHLVYIDSDSGQYDSASLQGNVLKELASQGVTVGSPGATKEANKEKSKDKKSKKAKHAK